MIKMTNCAINPVDFVKTGVSGNGIFAIKLTAMKNQLTTLALNLLISERYLRRAELARYMKETVENETDLPAVAEIFKRHYFLQIDRCVENPNCSSRAILFALSDFWNMHFKTRINAPLVAA